MMRVDLHGVDSKAEFTRRVKEAVRSQFPAFLLLSQSPYFIATEHLNSHSCFIYRNAECVSVFIFYFIFFWDNKLCLIKR
jgi:hypothetical protein